MSAPEVEDILSLLTAIIRLDLRQVKRLVCEGVDLNQCVKKESASTNAIQYGNKAIVNIIFKAPGFNPNVGNEFDRTPLYVAAKLGDLVLVKRLLSMGAAVDQPDILGITPLGASAWKDNPEMAHLLCSNGAKVNSASNTGETPLYRACSGGREALARALIQLGADLNICTNNTHIHPGHTPLMAALSLVRHSCINGIRYPSISEMVCLIELLIAKGSRLNARDFRGRSALHLAVQDNNLCAVCLLLEAGCDLNPVDNFGFSPLRWCLQYLKQRHYFAKILILYGADVDFKIQTSDKKKTDALAMIREMERKPSGSPAERHEMTRLIVSAMNPFRLESGRHSTPSEDQHGDLEDPLLDNILAQTQFTLQSLCRFAIRRQLGGGALEKVKQLPLPKRLKRYLDLDHDTARFHPVMVYQLYIAIAERDQVRIRDLVLSGTCVHAPLWDTVPLNLAVKNGDQEVVLLLLSLGARPGYIDRSGDSALHVAVRESRSSIAQLLVDTGMDIELRNRLKQTPLLEAAFVRDYTTFQMLLSSGADPNVCDKDGITPLHCMAGHGNVAMVQYLLDLRVDPEVTDSKGQRPVHVAASKGRCYSYFHQDECHNHAGVIRALADTGCDIHARNSLGRSALYIAKSNRRLGTKKIIRFLQNN